MMKCIKFLLLGIAVSHLLASCSSPDKPPSDKKIEEINVSESQEISSNKDMGPSDNPEGLPTPRFNSSQGRLEDSDDREYEIITLLPRDAIAAIDNPTFYSAEDADEEYTQDELVLGVEFNGDIRAYSIPLLSRHEIVNDTVGGVKIAVTW